MAKGNIYSKECSLCNNTGKVYNIVMDDYKTCPRCTDEWDHLNLLRLAEGITGGQSAKFNSEYHEWHDEKWKGCSDFKGWKNVYKYIDRWGKERWI